MKTLVLALGFAVSASAFAEDIPVKIRCEGRGGLDVRSAESSDKNLMFNKETMLIAGNETFIIQNQNFDLEGSQTAHLTGESQTAGYDHYLELSINFANGKGTIDIGGKKTALSNCTYQPW